MPLVEMQTTNGSSSGPILKPGERNLALLHALTMSIAQGVGDRGQSSNEKEETARSTVHLPDAAVCVRHGQVKLFQVLNVSKYVDSTSFLQ